MNDIEESIPFLEKESVESFYNELCIRSRYTPLLFQDAFTYKKLWNFSAESRNMGDYYLDQKTFKFRYL